MTLNDIVAALTAFTEALNANTAALTGGAAAAPEKAAATKSTKAASTKAAEPKGPSRDEMISALTEVKEKHGSEKAKSIIKDAGGVAKLADIPDGKIKAVFDAATKALGADDAAPEDDGL